MIVVDTSVWIDFFWGRDLPQVRALRARFNAGLIVGDLVLSEVLLGVRSEAQAVVVRDLLTRFDTVIFGSETIAAEAAANYRRLRAHGITIRRTIDLIIGTWCIVNGAALLHDDRDFDPMAQHLGLQVVPP